MPSTVNMTEDNIRIRIPSYLKQKFKDQKGRGGMTTLLRGIIISTLEGVSLAKMERNTSLEPKAKTTYDGDSDNYIRFLVSTDLKERFKLYCYLKGTNMSDFLREAVEEIIREEEFAASKPKVYPLVISSQTTSSDVSQLWSQAFGKLCA